MICDDEHRSNATTMRACFGWQAWRVCRADADIESRLVCGMSSAMYARTMLSKSVSARHAERGTELRREVRAATSRRSCRSPDRSCHLTRVGDGVARDACAAPRPSRRRRTQNARHVDRARVRERATAGASWPTIRLSMTARGEVTHILCRRRDRARSRRRRTAARG